MDQGFWKRTDECKPTFPEPCNSDHQMLMLGADACH